MVLKLVSVENGGTLDSERVVLRAPIDLSAGKYLILRARKSPDDKVFSGAIPGAYWFETIPIKARDLVVLYTKVGQRSSKVAEDGITSHFFYWSLSSAIWDMEHKPAVIWASGWHW